MEKFLCIYMYMHMKMSAMYQHVFYNYLRVEGFCMILVSLFIFFALPYFSERHTHVFSMSKRNHIFSFQDKKEIQWNLWKFPMKYVDLQHRKVGVWFMLRLVFCFVDMCKKNLSPEQDIKFSGHVSWVGKTSMEVKMHMFQVCLCRNLPPFSNTAS